MKISTKLTASLCLAAASLLLAGQASASTLLRWTEGSPDRGARAEAYHWFADTVTKRTNGDVQFQFYWGGALMPHAANVAGIGNGTADIGQIIAVYNPKELQAYDVGDLPLVGVDPWVGMQAMYEMATTNDTLKKMFDGLNLVYITNQTTGPIQMVCKKQNIKTLDDFKGVKVRAAGPYGQVMRDLGANVIALSQDDVYSALDSGLVACNQQYVQGVIPYRQHEVTDQLVMLNLGQNLGFGIVMNKDTFNKLPANDQQVIRETGKEFMDRYGQIMMRDIEDAKKKLTDPSSQYHLKLTNLSDADVDKLREVSKHYIGTWVDQADKAGLPGQQLLDQFVALTKKYDAVLKQNGYPWASK